MKKLIIALLINLCSIWTAEALAQTQATNIETLAQSLETPLPSGPPFSGVKQIIKYDFGGLLSKDFALEYERMIGSTNKSYNFRTGFQVSNNTPNLPTGKTINTYTERQTSSSFLFFITDHHTSYLGGEPLPNYGAFIPKFSIPLNNSFRFYNDFKENTKCYGELSWLLSFSHGYKIRQFKHSEPVNNSSGDLYGFGIPYSSNTKIKKVNERLDVTKANTISSGIALGFGFNSYISKSYFLDMKFEAGTNFINPRTYYDKLTISDYTMGKAYGKLKIMLGFSI